MSLVVALAVAGGSCQPAHAAHFDRPRTLSGEATGADTKVDGAGDIFVLPFNGDAYHLVRIPHGGWHPQSLRIPVPRQGGFGPARWDVTPSGAVAVGGPFFPKPPRRSKHGHLMLVTALPGHHFAPPRELVVPPHGVFGDLRISPLGRVVEWWRTHSESGLGVATAQLGGPLHRRRSPRRYVGRGDEALLGFDSRGRAVWSWRTWNLQSGNQSLDRSWTAVTTPDLSRPGTGKVTASWTYPADKSRYSQDLTLIDGRGGQIYVALTSPNHVYIRRSREGRRFGPPRDLTAPVAFIPQISGAVNSSGDTVFAWESDPTDTERGNVFAMVVRRNGRIVGPQALATNGDYVGEPQVGIDARGRALVVWTDNFDHTLEQLWPQRAAFASAAPAGRRFGAPREISTPSRPAYPEIHVGVGVNGALAVTFPTVNSQIAVVRGHL